MRPSGAQAFWQSLDGHQQAYLMSLRAGACQQRPAHWVEWRCGETCLGCMPPQRAQWLALRLEAARWAGDALIWCADSWSESRRSESLQAVLQQARVEGLLPGWRDERFSFWGPDCAHPDPVHAPHFQVERSGFRFLGLLSHAVHVNGFMSNGQLWCGRRSLHKATDPGMLDNITAGGLPSGEWIQDCLQRELAEEAGLFRLQDHGCQAIGHVRTSRQEPEGWHDEFLHVFNLTLADGFQPLNQDGEVSEFLCLNPSTVLAKLASGAFTQDAVQTLLLGLGTGTCQ
jgi:ADP-ribose pyrophosphatase YjhB (NUDIX family)